MSQNLFPPKKIVWIKCRAKEWCEGNQAEVVFDISKSPVGQGGTFAPEAGGRSIRYRCLSCKNVFHIHC